MHKGHRERLRNRLRNEGTDHFEDHQLLEALLTFAIPRKDTNETAHMLIEQTGSLASLFSAERDVLLQVDGVGETSVDLIKLVNGIMRRTLTEKSSLRDSYGNISSVVRYLSGRYFGLSVERVYLMLLDNSYRLIDCIHVCDGTINEIALLPRTIVNAAVTKHASSVILSHNHPFGTAEPSATDMETTRRLDIILSAIGINFLEHIVFAGNTYTPIKRRIKGDGGAETCVAIKSPSIETDESFYDDGVQT